MNPTVVIGLGNRLLSDEGIGLVLLEALARKAAEFPGVDFLDFDSLLNDEELLAWRTAVVRR